MRGFAEIAVLRVIERERFPRRRAVARSRSSERKKRTAMRRNPRLGCGTLEKAAGEKAGEEFLREIGRLIDVVAFAPDVGVHRIPVSLAEGVQRLVAAGREAARKRP
jgi:hypothetical protein